ncbi:MAG: tetratricopeptide repeat protein [Ramlibacter sp.]
MPTATLRFARASAALLVALAGTAQAGYQEGMDSLVARDYAKARAEFEADRANARSLYQLAVMAREGLGEPRNLVRAAGLLKEATDMGSDEAKLDYAYVLGNGTGVDGNGPEAIRLLEQLAAKGQLEGMVVLGRALRNGWWGQAKDGPRSTELFRRAWEGGDPNGRLLYAQALLDGTGVAKDPDRGLALVREGVERGHLPSQLEYARMLTYGEGVPRDEAAGLELYHTVAERGDRAAQFGVGLALLNGRGAPRDEKTGARWIDASARQGYGVAQLQLADMYRSGRGLPQRSGEAYFWYSVAARSSVPGVVERANAQRALLAPGMAPTQLASLAAKVSSFTPQPGFRPRANPLQPPAHTDRFELGGETIRIPAPAGFTNGWEMLEAMQQTYPNDSELAVLMVLHNTEDLDRLKLGLAGRMRTIEVSRNSPDDSVRITPALFAEMKKATRRSLENVTPAHRLRLDSTLRDDEDVYAVVRRGVQDPSRLDALTFVRVRDKALLIVYGGFDVEQRAVLTELVRTATEEILSANRGGFFSSR